MVLVAVGETIADRVVAEIERHLPVQARRTIIEQAFADRGAVLTAPTTKDAVIFANEFAPEHLLLADPRCRRTARRRPLGWYRVRGRGELRRLR